jgi:predicted metalloprotease with PDZ domain
MKPRSGAALAVLILLAWATTTLAVPSLDYLVTLDKLGDKRLRVMLALGGFEGDEIILRGVPSYMDNPVAAPKWRTVRKLRARNELGGELPIAKGKDSEGGRLWRIRPAAVGVTVVEYELSVSFKESRQTRNYPTQIPFMDKRRAWLAGNYVFCFPELNADARTAMRTPARIRVEFDLPGNLPLHGLPDGRIELGNLYELLSLQWGLGRFVTEQLPFSEPKVEMILRSEEEFDAGEREALRGWTVTIVETLTGFFGGAPFPKKNFYYFRNDGIGGLEGAYTCQAYVQYDVDLTDPDDSNVRSFLDVALHECFHTWNPIGMFAIGDPWFKEGITSYYGNVLTLRLGWLEFADYEAEWERGGKILSENPLFGEVPLTDPRIWHREYSGEEWRQLTYTRGHAVALLLDVLIRERTENRRSLDDVMRRLFSDHARGHFTHVELLRAITGSTGIDADAFFSEYVSGVRVPGPAEVERALAVARRLGVFEVETSTPR